MRSTACREGGRPSIRLDGFPREPGGYDYMCGALGFCCHKAIRVPEGSSKMANHPWPGTSFFGAMIFPPAFLTFSWYSSTEFTERQLMTPGGQCPGCRPRMQPPGP